MQAGEHPAHRARHIDVAQELARARSEHARVGEHHRADLAHALVHIEEHDEEHESHAQRDLGGNAETEPNEENRRQDHARHGVDRLDVRVEYRRGGRRQREPQSDHHSGHRADQKGKQRLDQRHPQMFVDFPRGEPPPQASEHLDRFAEKERRLVGFREIDRREQGRARQDVPERDKQREHQHLEAAQAQAASFHPSIVFAAGHNLSALPPSSSARFSCEFR